VNGCASGVWRGRTVLIASGSNSILGREPADADRAQISAA
jgi:hypothetical protein